LPLRFASKQKQAGVFAERRICVSLESGIPLCSKTQAFLTHSMSEYGID
jgi:hypothetical protein